MVKLERVEYVIPSEAGVEEWLVDDNADLRTATPKEFLLPYLQTVVRCAYAATLLTL